MPSSLLPVELRIPESNRFDPRNSEPEEFLAAAQELGIAASAARSFSARVIQTGLVDAPSAGRRNAISRRLGDAAGILPRLRLVEVQRSQIDPFVKLAFATADDLILETVAIPLHKPGAVSVCLSSQVGCAMGCLFCKTASMPRRRSLATWEIVDQFIQARQFAIAEGRRVTGAVFMGMGEPFLNYDRVLAAAEVLSCPWGGAIAAKAITISTVGLVSEIDRYTRENRRFRLSISLGAADDSTRKSLLPVAAAAASVAELMAAARRHIASRGQGRMNLSYVCISGVNMREEDAIALGRLIGDMPVRLDLIEVTDPSGRFRPPDSQELSTFRDLLRQHVGQPVVRRYSGGADINASCGTLAGQVSLSPK